MREGLKTILTQREKLPLLEQIDLATEERLQPRPATSDHARLNKQLSVESSKKMVNTYQGLRAKRTPCPSAQS